MTRSRALRVLVWQWGRRGAGPRFAAELAHGLGLSGDIRPLLSLSAQAEIVSQPGAPPCALRVVTYGGLAGLIGRIACGPVLVGRLWRWLRRERPELAICAMAGPLDLFMAAALGLLGIPFALVVHEVAAHPGDRWRLQYGLQRHIAGRASLLVALSRHVAGPIAAAEDQRRRLVLAEHPPFALIPSIRAPRSHGGPLRVLLFGRLLRYKGLDLLAGALTELGVRDDLSLRVVGQGPETADLDRLRRLPGVTVENRWVPEAELDALFAWSDVVLLTHREASQSGVAAAALGAGRWIIATRVGGLPEQLAGQAGALLCEPEAGAVAQALRDVLTRPAAAAAPVDAARHWEDFGTRIVNALEARRRPATGPSHRKFLLLFSKRRTVLF